MQSNWGKGRIKVPISVTIGTLIPISLRYPPSLLTQSVRVHNPLRQLKYPLKRNLVVLNGYQYRASRSAGLDKHMRQGSLPLLRQEPLGGSRQERRASIARCLRSRLATPQNPKSSDCSVLFDLVAGLAGYHRSESSILSVIVNEFKK
jgi:hypothetical protein